MLGAFLLAAAGGAEIAELRTFKDWVVGCDNGLLCQAAAMMPEGQAGATLTVRRAPEGDATPEVWLRAWEGDASDISVDGKALRIRLTKNDDDAYVVDPAESVRLLDALRSANSANVLDAAGKPIDSLSVSGATAALLYMDEKQRRLGTRGALVRRGDAPDSSVPPPPHLPARYTVRGSATPPAQLSPEFVAKVRKDNDCPDETDSHLVSHDRLDERHTLAVITLICQSGAYNYFSANYVIPDGGTPREAPFEDEADEVDGDLHYNLSWDPDDRRLHAGFKGRGIGDCGARQQYAWDGERFRLVRVEAMGDCRGVVDFITLWRARVVER